MRFAPRKTSRGRASYLVSGDQNIRPSHENLRRAAKTVRFDDEVHDSAAIALKSGGRFIVVAHGQKSGIVTWFKSSRGSAVPWLWVGMSTPPTGAKVYLYSCFAGLKLPKFLTACQVFGHSDVVPMPTGDSERVVLGYLNEVEKLIVDQGTPLEAWRAKLGAYINRAYAAEVLRPTGLMNVAALLMIRRSLGFVDE